MIPPHTGASIASSDGRSASKLCTDIKRMYNNSSDSDQELILNLALSLSDFLSVHLKLLENDQNWDVLLNAHLYVVKISRIDEREVFKITLEYWSSLVSSLYEEPQTLRLADTPPHFDPSPSSSIDLCHSDHYAASSDWLDELNPCISIVIRRAVHAFRETWLLALDLEPFAAKLHRPLLFKLALHVGSSLSAATSDCSLSSKSAMRKFETPSRHQNV
jgi:hypothetical protein